MALAQMWVGYRLEAEDGGEKFAVELVSVVEHTKSGVSRLLAFHNVLRLQFGERPASLKFNIHARQLDMNVVGEENDNWIENETWFIRGVEDRDVMS